MKNSPCKPNPPTTEVNNEFAVPLHSVERRGPFGIKEPSLIHGETPPCLAFALLAFAAAFEALVAIAARSFPVRTLRASLHDRRIKFSLRLWIVGPVTGEHFIFVNCPHFIPVNVYVHVFVAHNRRAMWNYDGPILRHPHRHARQYR